MNFMPKASIYRRPARIFDVNSTGPFKISRSKIDLFVKCARCFYMEARFGVKRPDTYPLTLNIAVDHLLKKEFDIHRNGKTQHPMMKTYGVSAVPFAHPKMDDWRNTFKGVEHLHEPTNLMVFGAVDDIWVDLKNGDLMVVDYKATARRTAPTLDGDLGAQYQRQMEVYQWLLRGNGFQVSPTGYFVYVNGKKDAKAFDGKLEFDVSILPCQGETAWVEPTLEKIKACLLSEEIPKMAEDCDYCIYRQQAAMKDFENKKKNGKKKAEV